MTPLSNENHTVAQIYVASDMCKQRRESLKESPENRYTGTPPTAIKGYKRNDLITCFFISRNQ